MAYSEIPPSGSGPSGGYEGGYGEYPSSGGEGGAPPEEEPEEEMGYLSPRVQMLRRIRSVALVVEVLLMVVFIWLGYTWRMADFEGLSMKPWWPVQPTLFYVLLFGVIMSITGIIFRILEIQATESGSQKVLLANSAFRGALSTMVVAIVFLVLVMYLPTTSFVKDSLVSKEDATKGLGEETYRFKVQDEFQVTRVTNIKVTTDNQETLALVKKDIYDNFTHEYQQYLDGNRTYPVLMNYVNETGSTLVLNSTQLSKDTTSLTYGEWDIYVYVDNDAGAKIHYEITREVQPDLLSTLTTFLLMFAIIDGAWMVAALVIKQRYKGYSIYT